MTNEGRLVTRKLPDEELERYRGLLGHYHIQANKVDPGPAFQWDAVVEGARELMGAGAGKGFEVITRGNARMPLSLRGSGGLRVRE